jgi:SAM-dependent methyltransferase
MLQVYNNHEYFQGGGEYGYANLQGCYPVQELSLKLTFRKLLGKLRRLGMAGGSLLEVGCGYGYLLEEARSLFDTLTGTDYDEKAIDHIRALGFHGLRGGIESIPPEEKYELVLSVNVIEHVYYPVTFVHQLSRHLAPGGWMVLATPKMNGFWFHLLGKQWPSFKIPEHVAYYDRATLSDLLLRCGPRELRALPLPHAFPLGLMAEKLGLSLPTWLARHIVWLNGVIFAVAARF